MSGNSSKIQTFFREVKRRKVVRRNMVYLATAFVILEFVSIIEEPTGLPDWSLKVVLIALLIGFVFSVVLSWFYDFSEYGFDKIKSPGELEKIVREKPSRILGWKIAAISSAAVIVSLILFNIFGKSVNFRDPGLLEKSIAVLPFINDSPDEENNYFVNGIMEEILINLQAINEFSVISRNSVEQYRDIVRPTTPEIGRQLNVNYIVEGSGQKYGNTFRLRIQLIEANTDKHLWADSYEQKIEDLDDIFRIQSEIAQAIAKALKAVITPEEKQQIEKTRTTNLMAYDYFQQGNEQKWKFDIEGDRQALKRAEYLYNKALENDPSYAQVYAELAWVYFKYSQIETSILKEDYQDSVLVLADMGLSYDKQLEAAYIVKGYYYDMFSRNREKTIQYFNKAIDLNKNSWAAYRGLGWAHWPEETISVIENFHKSATLNPESRAEMLYYLGLIYGYAGLFDKAVDSYRELLQLSGDSTWYFTGLAIMECWQGHYEKCIEYATKVYKSDANRPPALNYLAISYMMLGQFEEALKFYEKYIENMLISPRPNLENRVWIAYVYLKNGQEDKAEYYFNQENFSDHHQAKIFAFKGEKEKAYDLLRKAFEDDWVPYFLIVEMNNDPLFDRLRGEPEFQQILNEFEAKAKAHNQSVKSWLEENDI